MAFWSIGTHLYKGLAAAITRRIFGDCDTVAERETGSTSYFNQGQIKISLLITWAQDFPGEWVTPLDIMFLSPYCDAYYDNSNAGHIKDMHFAMNSIKVC
jgi:hypothetical protein